MTSELNQNKPLKPLDAQPKARIMPPSRKGRVIGEVVYHWLFNSLAIHQPANSLQFQSNYLGSVDKNFKLNKINPWHQIKSVYNTHLIKGAGSNLYVYNI